MIQIPDTTIAGSEVIYNKYLKTTGSLVLVLEGILYGNKNLPEGVILHFLNVEESY